MHFKLYKHYFQFSIKTNLQFKMCNHYYYIIKLAYIPYPANNISKLNIILYYYPDTIIDNKFFLDFYDRAKKIVLLKFQLWNLLPSCKSNVKQVIKFGMSVHLMNKNTINFRFHNFVTKITIWVSYGLAIMLKCYLAN